MVARGRVQDGVIVLDNGVRFPEGQVVTVLAHVAVPPTPRVEGSQSHSVLDIATVSLGSVIRPLTSDDDLLGEMLEGRP
jgi:hypothetical protein